MKIKFTVIDYIIIILVICAVIFAFIHITTDDSSDLQKTAFDESTINKIPETYLKYYKDGYIINATVEGFNSTTDEAVSITGNVIWEDDSGGGDVKLLIETENNTYLTGLYRYNPDSDIYIDYVSLQTNGEKCKDLCEITIEPEEITSLNELVSGIANDTEFEISTTVSLDDFTARELQEISNLLLKHDKRSSIKTSMEGQVIIVKATRQNIEDADSVLGDIDGITDRITVRIYNSTDKQIETIKDNYDVINIKKF